MALWCLALLAPVCVLASDLPEAWAWPLAVVAGMTGIRLARRYRRQAPLALLIPAGRGAPTCDAEPVECLLVRWRGPLAFLRWRDRAGRTRRLVFAPDTLAGGAARELELAMQRREAAAGGPSVAG